MNNEDTLIEQHLCDYGCGQQAIYKFKNGKYCCSKVSAKCPAVKIRLSNTVHKNLDKWKQNNETCRHHSIKKDKRKRLKVDNQGKCDNPGCTNYNDGSYGSGRFCSEECRDKYVAFLKINAHNPNVKKHLDKLREEKIPAKAPYGTWKCEECNLIFETNKLLLQHNSEFHGYLISKHLQNGKYECPYCHRIFTNQKSILAHLSSCKKHPHYTKHKISHILQGNKLKQRYMSHELIPSFLGRTHTPETKQKLCEKTISYRESMIGKPFISYNKRSIQYLDNLSKEMGWNLQHAENGGEVRMFGYFLDAYDKEKNIVVEYDEPGHYRDVENNILVDKDIERQNYIIEHLHCQFYRYNEKTKVLWKVE